MSGAHPPRRRYFLLTFQNTGAGATSMPSMLVRMAIGRVPLAKWHVRGVVGPVLLQVDGDLLLLGRVDSLEKASRIFSIVSSHGQPNIALSHEALKKPAITGLRMSAATQESQHQVPAALRRRVFLDSAGDNGLPVARLHVDLEAGGLQL